MLANDDGMQDQIVLAVGGWIRRSSNQLLETVYLDFDGRKRACGYSSSSTRLDSSGWTSSMASWLQLSHSLTHSLSLAKPIANQISSRLLCLPGLIQTDERLCVARREKWWRRGAAAAKQHANNYRLELRLLSSIRVFFFMTSLDCSFRFSLKISIPSTVGRKTVDIRNIIWHIVITRQSPTHIWVSNDEEAIKIAHVRETLPL